MAQKLLSDPAICAPSCIIKIAGGLGNQMLQYAAGRAVSLRHNCPLVLDLSFYGRRRHRRFELGAFPIAARIAPPARGWRRLFGSHSLQSDVAPAIYQEASRIHDPSFSLLTPPVELRGYFFSEKYFVDYAEIIRRELTPPACATADALNLKARMDTGCSTSLHVRRGDYVTSKNASRHFCSCPIEYYEEAIDQIPGDGEVFVFSDDIAWARENLRSSKPLVFVSHGSGKESPGNVALRDLWLMTQATHHIIANSSFSWWGAWLAEPRTGLTLAPRKWFNDPVIDDSDMIPEHWIRL